MNDELLKTHNLNLAGHDIPIIEDGKITIGSEEVDKIISVMQGKRVEHKKSSFTKDDTWELSTPYSVNTEKHLEDVRNLQRQKNSVVAILSTVDVLEGNETAKVVYEMQKASITDIVHNIGDGKTTFKLTGYVERSTG